MRPIYDDSAGETLSEKVKNYALAIALVGGITAVCVGFAIFGTSSGDADAQLQCEYEGKQPLEIIYHHKTFRYYRCKAYKEYY